MIVKIDNFISGLNIWSEKTEKWLAQILWLFDENNNRVGYIDKIKFGVNNVEHLILDVFVPNEWKRELKDFLFTDTLVFRKNLDDVEQAKDFAFKNYDNIVKDYYEKGIKNIVDYNKLAYPERYEEKIIIKTKPIEKAKKENKPIQIIGEQLSLF